MEPGSCRAAPYLKTPMPESPVNNHQTENEDMKSGVWVLFCCTCIWGSLCLRVLLRLGRRRGHEKWGWVLFMLYLYLRTPMAESPVATRQKTRIWNAEFVSFYAALVSEDPYGWESSWVQAEDEDMKRWVRVLLCCTCIWGLLCLRVLLRPGRRRGHEKRSLGPVILHLYLRTPVAECLVTTRKKTRTWKVGFGFCLCCTWLWGPYGWEPCNHRTENENMKSGARVLLWCTCI